MTNSIPMPGVACVMKDKIVCSDHVITTIPVSSSPSSVGPDPAASPFQRFANRVRRSFNRIRISRRRKPVKNSRNLADKDDATTSEDEEIRPTGNHGVIKSRGDVDCESVDSGLETDHSSDLTTSSSKTRDYPSHGINTKSCLRKETGYSNILSPSHEPPPLASSNRSSSYYPDSLLSSSAASSANIDRKSSGRSNHTIDSGILVNNKRSPPSRNLRYEEILPKKRVSILLPERPLQHAKLVRSPGENTRNYSSGLVQPVETDVIAEAMHELMDINSQHCDIIFLMFVPRPNLKALSADDIGRILFGIYSVLRNSDMRHLHFFEISIWMLQRFVFKVSRLLENRPGLCHQPIAWESLIRRSEIMKYSRHSSILEDTRALFLELWCSLLGA